MNFRRDLIKYYFVKGLDICSVLTYLNFHVRKTLYGSTFEIPVLKRIGMHNLVSGEPWLYEIIAFLCSQKKGSFIDVGVNIGQTLLKVRAIDGAIPYIGFEPNPVCSFYVHKLVEANGFEDVLLYPVGLSSEQGLLELYANNEYASGASVIKNFRKFENIRFVYQVPVMRGDEIFSNRGSKPAVVKIDVEGFESDVISGLRQTIKYNRPFIICEVLPVYSTETSNGKLRKQRQDSLLIMLGDLNYQFFLIDEQRIRLKSLDTIQIHGDMTKTNYLFCHQEDFDSIAELIDY